MPLERARSSDHVDLTFMYAKLLKEGFLEREDVEKLREMKERLEDHRIDTLLESLRYIGAGRFLPADTSSFIMTLDNLRYDVHRVIEKKLEAEDVEITDKDLLAAVPEKCHGDVKIVEWSETRIDETVTRNIIARERAWGTEGELRISIEDNFDEKTRYAKVSMVYKGVIDVDVDPVDIYCKKEKLHDENCYVIEKADCEWFKVRELTGEVEWKEKCTIDLNELIKARKTGRATIDVSDVLSVLRYSKCKVWRKANKIEAVCPDEWRYDIIQHIDEYAWESGALENYYIENFLPDIEKDYESLGETTPIPLKCEVEYAYPHGHGFFYYARCSGSKKYPLDVEGSAVSLREINRTLESACKIE